METIGNYPTLADAELAQSLLEAEGIIATIPEEHIAGIDWRWATALQGIRLQVDEEDAGAARALLEEKGEIEHEPPQQLDLCPQCGSPEITESPWKRRLKAATMLMPVLLLVWPFVFAIEPKMKCEACGHRWCSPK